MSMLAHCKLFCILMVMGHSTVSYRAARGLVLSYHLSLVELNKPSAWPNVHPLEWIGFGTRWAPSGWCLSCDKVWQANRGSYLHAQLPWTHKPLKYIRCAICCCLTVEATFSRPQLTACYRLRSIFLSLFGTVVSMWRSFEGFKLCR